jgi:hypothetical protein
MKDPTTIASFGLEMARGILVKLTNVLGRVNDTA